MGLFNNLKKFYSGGNVSPAKESIQPQPSLPPTQPPKIEPTGQITKDKEKDSKEALKLEFFRNLNALLYSKQTTDYNIRLNGGFNKFKTQPHSLNRSGFYPNIDYKWYRVDYNYDALKNTPEFKSDLMLFTGFEYHFYVNLENKEIKIVNYTFFDCDTKLFKRNSFDLSKGFKVEVKGTSTEPTGINIREEATVDLDRFIYNGNIAYDEISKLIHQCLDTKSPYISSRNKKIESFIKKYEDVVSYNKHIKEFSENFDDIDYYLGDLIDISRSWNKELKDNSEIILKFEIGNLGFKKVEIAEHTLRDLHLDRYGYSNQTSDRRKFVNSANFNLTDNLLEAFKYLDEVKGRIEDSIKDVSFYIELSDNVLKLTIASRLSKVDFDYTYDYNRIMSRDRINRGRYDYTTPSYRNIWE